MTDPSRRPSDGRRILHLLASAERRGAEVFALDLVERLTVAGFEGEPLALAAGPAGGPTLPVPVAPAGPVRLARHLRARARTVDLVIGHGSRALPAGTLATLGLGTPFVYRSIGDIARWGAATASRRARVGPQLRRAAGVVALWPEAAATIHTRLGVPRDRIEVIPNGVPAERFVPAPPERRARARQRLGLGDGTVVAVVGAHGPEKRIPLAVEAALARAGTRVVVAGDGPERPLVEAAAARDADRATVLGAVDDVTTVYDAADAVLSTSATEGQPGALIEAALSGLAVVATDVGGCASVVGPRGVVVPPDAGPARIATALDEALARPPLSPSHRAELEDRFDIARVADRWAALATRLIDDPGPWSAPGRVARRSRA